MKTSLSSWTVYVEPGSTVSQRGWTTASRSRRTHSDSRSLSGRRSFAFWTIRPMDWRSSAVSCSVTTSGSRSKDWSKGVERTYPKSHQSSPVVVMNIGRAHYVRRAVLAKNFVGVLTRYREQVENSRTILVESIADLAPAKRKAAISREEQRAVHSGSILTRRRMRLRHH